MHDKDKQIDLTKIAIIEPVGGHGGMDYYDFGLCDGLAKAGVEVVLYTCDETKLPRNSNFKVRKWYRKIYGKNNILLRGLFFLFATIKIFFDIILKKINVVHFHFFVVGVLQLFSVLIAKSLNRKVVITVHDVEDCVEGKGNFKLAKIAYRLSDKIIVHNSFSKSELLNILDIPDEHISVIPHGNYRHAYPNLIPQDIARNQLNLPDKDKVLLFFGQIKKIKRLDLLLEAFSIVVKKHPNTRLIIAGKEIDVPFSEYRLLMLKYNIVDKCTCLTHYIKNEDVPMLYAASDLVVLPYERIYQSGVLLMAMSFSRSVIVSDIPGMLEVVTNNETGYTFVNRDANDLAKCLDKVLENDFDRNKVAKNSFDFIVSNFNWDTIGQKHKDLYDLLLQ